MLSMGWTTPKLPLPLDDVDPVEDVGSLSSHESPPNRISLCSATYAGLTNVSNRQTHRLTDHATLSAAIGRIYAMHAMWPNNKPKENHISLFVRYYYCLQFTFHCLPNKVLP